MFVYQEIDLLRLIYAGGKVYFFISIKIFKVKIMARMHSRKKGKSGSTRPVEKKQPSWIRYSDKEVEMIITKLAKEGNSTSKIGLILRDSYGIPDAKQVIGKKITQLLGEKSLTGETPEDMTFLIRRAIKLRKHLEKNHHDMGAKRGLQLTESKIKRLAKYYKRSGKLSEDWKYQPEKVSLYAE